MVFHYAQEIFEGMKAYRTADDTCLLYTSLLQMKLHQLAPLQAIPRHGFRHKGKAQLAFDQREHLVCLLYTSWCYLVLVFFSFLCLFFFYILVINSTRTH